MQRRKSNWDIQAQPAAQDNGSPKSATEDARERAAKLTAMLAAKGKLANMILELLYLELWYAVDNYLIVVAKNTELLALPRPMVCCR